MLTGKLRNKYLLCKKSKPLVILLEVRLGMVSSEGSEAGYVWGYHQEGSTQSYSCILVIAILVMFLSSF